GILIETISMVTDDTPLIFLILLLIVSVAFGSVQFTCMNTISISYLINIYSNEGKSIIEFSQQLSISLGISIVSFVLLLMSNWSFLEQKGKVFPFKGTFLVLGILTVLSSLIFAQLRPDDGNRLSGTRRVH